MIKQFLVQSQVALIPNQNSPKQAQIGPTQSKTNHRFQTFLHEMPRNKLQVGQ